MSENQTKRTRLVSKRQAGVIGGAAGVEIAVRGLDITIPSIIDTALAIVVVGLSSKMFPKTAEVAMWMFYLTLVFILLSNLFPQSLDRIRTDRPLLGLLAIGTIGTAIPANTIVAAVGETSQSPSESLTGQNYALISSFTVLILIFLCLSAYLFALRRDRYLADDWLLEAVYTPDKIRRIRRYRNRRNPFDYVFLGVAFGTLPLLLIQVVFFLSLFVVVVSGFYPIPEVAFVSTAVISAFGLPERTRLPAPNIEFESGLGRSL
jgi:hypothetical protein